MICRLSKCTTPANLHKARGKRARNHIPVNYFYRGGKLNCFGRYDSAACNPGAGELTPGTSAAPSSNTYPTLHDVTVIT